MDNKPGTLYLIATPIGNLKDITIRAIEKILTVDILLCEDTRVSGKLIENIVNVYQTLNTESEITKPKLISYHDHNEFRLNPQVTAWLKEGKQIGLITDAGTPLISDPGYKLVRECLQRNIIVESIPGPSSVITALTLSGFPPDKFTYLGYLPRKSGQRQNLFKSLLTQPFDHITYIVFESPHRLLSSLEDLQGSLGNIEVTICRELTKMHQEITTNVVSNVIESYQSRKILGEIVIVFSVEKEKKG